MGCYSAFIVAEKVEVLTRRAGEPAAAGVHWESEGEAEFTIEPIEKAERGTTVILRLKPDCAEFADDWRVRSVIRKYSDHISAPVKMPKAPATAEKVEEGKAPEAKAPPLEMEYETVNEATALWTRPRKDISEEEYKAFYQHVSHDFEAPLVWSHNRLEGKLAYTSLLYIPRRAPFDLWNREGARGLKLYVQRTFIMDDAEQFLPLYLRFVKGVVDSSDLSLNVSRELLQKDPQVDAMRAALVKRVLDMLEKMATSKPEDYAQFWKEFGQVLKEGPAEDPANREKIAKLLRFSTTLADSEVQDQSLEGYIARMKEGQSKIYYVAAENFRMAKNSPHLEVFRQRGIEALLLYDRIDEWLLSHLGEFAGKPFRDAARGELDLGELGEGELSGEEKAERERQQKDAEGLIGRLREALQERVSEVRATARLTESPACLAVGEQDLGPQMRRIMQAAGQDMPANKPILEINPAHPLVAILRDEKDAARFGDLAAILLDQATLAEGGTLEDPAAYVTRLNKLLLSMNR